MNSTKESTPKTQGGWNTFGVNVRRRENIIQFGGINERRRRDEHVLGAQHVTVDRYVCNVTEIN